MNNNSTALRLRMTIRGNMTGALLVGIFVLGMAGAASAGDKPRIISFDAPGAGATAGSFEGTACYSDCSVLINNFGAITGTYEDANNVFHGFVRSPEGKFTSFEAPGQIRPR